MKPRLLSFLVFLSVCLSAENYPFKNSQFQKNQHKSPAYESMLLEPLQDELYRNMMTLDDIKEVSTRNKKKPLTLMIFMAAANDLFPFSIRNMQQMQQIGSNDNLNIVIQINTPGAFSPTKRYVIKPNRRLPVDLEDDPLQKLNSGCPYTLIDFVKWTKDHYPADEYALILWNHGTGANDPGIPRSVDASELFAFNPENHMLEIDRTVGFLDFVAQKIKRGICFDETFGSYMTNQDIDFALYEICTNVLQKKLSLIGFDACLMSMIEIANICKKYAQVMVGSQELELGLGWDYEGSLKAFNTKKLNAWELGKNIVSAYAQFYQNITPDFTQSAIDLQHVANLEKNIDHLAYFLIEALDKQEDKSVYLTIKKAKSKKYCVYFNEPTYIDLYCFLEELSKRTGDFKFKKNQNTNNLTAHIKTLCLRCLENINQAVFSNKVGSNLKRARGLSIYFPEQNLLHSYLRNPFALENCWSRFIAKYIQQ